MENIYLILIVVFISITTPLFHKIIHIKIAIVFNSIKSKYFLPKVIFILDKKYYFAKKQIVKIQFK